MRWLLGVAVLLLWVPAANAETISDYATTMVGSPTPVSCEHMKPPLAGYTVQVIETDHSYFEPTIHLNQFTCETLRQLIAGNVDRELDAIAILTLTHEAEHIILNSGDEGVVECNAILRIDAALRLFNVYSPATHAYAWASHWGAPELYQTDPVCRAHDAEGIQPELRPRGGHAWGQLRQGRRTR